MYRSVSEGQKRYQRRSNSGNECCWIGHWLFEKLGGVGKLFALMLACSNQYNSCNLVSHKHHLQLYLIHSQTLETGWSNRMRRVLLSLYWDGFIEFIDKGMYVHQALPKGFNNLKNPTYQIKKKSQPKQKLTTPRLHKDLSEQVIIKHSSSEKAHLHHISSKEKPHLSSLEKNGKPSQLPKQIYSICLKKNEENRSEQARESPIRRHKITPRSSHQPTKEIVMCRMENKVTKTIDCPFYYSDLSQIEPAFWHVYEGQSKNNGIRHGFGIQYYINGEKFIGSFIDNKANGQGTYYSLRKKIMGTWQNDRLKETYLQL